jgi:hypothetical protein
MAQPRLRLVRPEEGCSHIVNNGRGIVFACCRKAHQDPRHAMQRVA